MKCNFLGKTISIVIKCFFPSFVPLDCRVCSRRLFIKHYARDSLTRRLMAEKCKFEHVNLVGVSRKIPQRILVSFPSSADFFLSSKVNTQRFWLCAFELRIRVGAEDAFSGLFSVFNHQSLADLSFSRSEWVCYFRGLIAKRRQRFFGREFFGVFWEARKVLKLRD